MNDESNQDIATIAGFLAESVVGSMLSSVGGLDISYLPPQGNEPKLDFVITIGDQRIPIEVKYRNTVKSEHYKGLEWFVSNPLNRAPFGILISKNPVESSNDQIISIPLKHFLLLR